MDKTQASHLHRQLIEQHVKAFARAHQLSVAKTRCTFSPEGLLRFSIELAPTVDGVLFDDDARRYAELAVMLGMQREWLGGTFAHPRLGECRLLGMRRSGKLKAEQIRSGQIYMLDEETVLRAFGVDLSHEEGE